MIKKVPHCRIPYLVKSSIDFYKDSFYAIYHDYFVYRDTKYEFIVFYDKKCRYCISIETVVGSSFFYRHSFRIYGKYGFQHCPFFKIPQLVYLMFSNYLFRLKM